MDPFVVIPIQTDKHVNFEAKRQKYISLGFLITELGHLSDPSTVGYKGNNIINEDVRKSSTIKNIRVNLDLPYKFQNKLKDQLSKIVPICYRSFDFGTILHYDYDDSDDHNQRKWDLLIYTQNDKFTRHRDGKDSDSHHATLLLFPPTEINQFEGGELVFYQSGQQIAKIQPNTFSQWTLVAFPTNVEHECLPVLSGTRYVFKSQLHLPQAFEKLYKIDNPAQPVTIKLSDIEPEIAEHENQITKYEEKIKKIRKTIDQLRQLSPSPQTLQIVQQIQEDTESNNYIVILDRYYDQPDPDYLIGEDRLLYNSIVSLYPQTKLGQIENAKHCLGDGSDGASKELYFQDDYIENSQIIYQKDLSKGHTPGSVTDHESEYNDQTYDQMAITDLTVIVVLKQ